MSETAGSEKPGNSSVSGMLSGVAVAFGIILASIPVPVVHFITFPVGPFIAGFVGGGIAKADEAKIIVFGLLVAGLALIPAIILLAVALTTDVSFGVPDGLVIGAAVALVPYTWFGVTIGALIGYLFRRNESAS
jgi:hypothetical protein